MIKELKNVQEQINIVDNYIAEKQFDKVFIWAECNYVTNSKVIFDKVIECYNICVKENMPKAALSLGSIYYTGTKIKRDYIKAFGLYKIAADAGISAAICNVAYCYYYGRHQEIDYNSAFKYFSIGATVFNDYNCLYKLGDMYLNGYATEKNEKYAFNLYNRANERYITLTRYTNEDYEEECEYSSILGDVEFRLGKCYLKGIGTKIDFIMAHAHLLNALKDFYKRRKTDPFVKGLIEQTKELIAEVQQILDQEIVKVK